MDLINAVPLAAEVLLICGTLLGLSVAIYLLLCRVMRRVIAAVMGPLLAMLVGWLYVAIRVFTMRRDSYVLDVMMLAPPFVFGLILPISAGLLLWVLATRGRVARRRA